MTMSETPDLPGELIDLPDSEELLMDRHNQLVSDQQQLVSDYEEVVSVNVSLHAQIKKLQHAATKHLNQECQYAFEIHKIKQELQSTRGLVSKLKYEMSNLELELNEKNESLKEALEQFKDTQLEEDFIKRFPGNS